MDTVSYMKSLIQQGDMFQVVPSIIYSYPHYFKENVKTFAYQLYQNLKRQNPSPYMYYIDMDKPIIVGVRQKVLLKCKHNKL